MEDPDYRRRLAANRDAWDEKAAIHATGEHETYDLQAFRAGDPRAVPPLPDDIGDVEGLSMLHLQCHFGMDTLAWARRGARVTGVDFSPVAVDIARRLSRELDIPARFVQADVLQLPDHLQGRFDVVLTYYGTITWLPDLRRWARVIERFLAPGGFFYLADTHPVAQVLEQQPGEPELRAARDYFASAPERYETERGTYAAPQAPRRHGLSYEWQHTLGDVVNALLEAGLRLDYLHEFPHTFHDMFYYGDDTGGPRLMERGPDGWWRLRENPDRLPLMFSLHASRPEAGRG